MSYSSKYKFIETASFTTSDSVVVDRGIQEVNHGRKQIHDVDKIVFPPTTPLKPCDKTFVLDIVTCHHFTLNIDLTIKVNRKEVKIRSNYSLGWRISSVQIRIGNTRPRKEMYVPESNVNQIVLLLSLSGVTRVGCEGG